MKQEVSIPQRKQCENISTQNEDTNVIRNICR